MLEARRALVIVAHPDDETLWAGGLIVTHTQWRWTIVSLCRRNDPDRAPKFFKVLDRLGAAGVMGALDDGPDQRPLAATTVEAAVRALLPAPGWDVVVTHSPFGEYTRHRRHEEVSRAVTTLWERGELVTRDLRLFAYEDGERRYLPRAIDRAHRRDALDSATFETKRQLIEDVYGFSPGSWEAQVTPKTEAFWCFEDVVAYHDWKRTEEQRLRGGHP